MIEGEGTEPINALRSAHPMISNRGDPFVIAEMACAHDGSIEKAERIIDASVSAGADAVQLQIFRADHTVTPQHKLYPTLRRIEFSDQEWIGLSERVLEKGVPLFVCTYDKESVKLIPAIGASGVKINAADLSNPPVLEMVARTTLPIFLGTGASTFLEIEEALEYLLKEQAGPITLMHGVQQFPTPFEAENIDRVRLLKKVFSDRAIGFAGHTEGSSETAMWMEYLALGAGAKVIEKHITWDRSEKGIDHEAALEPKAFSEFVSNLRRASSALGEASVGKLSDSDLAYRKFQRKSIVAAKAIPQGKPLERDDVVFLRNQEVGVSPILLERLLGQRTKRSIQAFENLSFEDLLE